MTVRLQYDLTGTGWAKCEVEIDGHHAVATASYLSDALDELCRAVVAVLRGEPSASASFEEEPGEYRWHLARTAPGRLRVQLRWFDDQYPPRPDVEGSVVFDAECRLRTFAGALLSELQRLHRTYGEAGYHDRWVEHEFPTKRVTQLTELLGTPDPEASRPAG
jgi:hypothetical protein